MKSILKDISVPNIITPGDMYILHKSKNSWHEPGPIIHMYFIKSDEEIMPAIGMEISYSDYELKKFIGWDRVSSSCVEFKFLIYDSEAEKEVEYSIFLHRIKTVPEALDMFSDDTRENILT